MTDDAIVLACLATAGITFVGVVVTALILLWKKR